MPAMEANGPTCMMWLHALQCMYKHGSTLEIYFPLLRDDTPLNFASWPEGVPHRAPRVIRIRAEIAVAVFSSLKAWGFSRNLQMYNAGFVGCRLDRIGHAILTQINSTPVSIKAEPFVIKAVVAEGIRGPQIGLGTPRVEDFGVELACCTETTVEKYKLVLTSSEV